MSDHSFPITTNSATKLFPEELPDLKQPWDTLVKRTDDMAMTDRPAGTKNNNLADAFEGEWLTSRPELMRMFPTEARLVPFFAGVSKEVSDEQVKEVPAGDTEFLAPPPWARRESVPVDDISGSYSTSDGYLDLHALAERMAQTTPGSSDGITELLMYTDLAEAKPFMTSGELQAIREIERRYFPWQIPNQAGETFEVSAYTNDDTGVSVDLGRIKGNHATNVNIGGTATINRSIDNHSVTVKAPAGSRVLVSGLRIGQGTLHPVDNIVTVPESGELELRISDLTYRSSYNNYPPNRVGVLVVKPNETAGLPEIIDKVVLDLPDRITDRVSHRAPDA